MLALDREVVLPVGGDRVVVVGVALLEIEAALLHLEDADVRVVRGAIVVVLVVAGPEIRNIR